MTEEAAPPLELRGISKSFGGVAALRDVDFVLRAGEIHGLVGENGAGKSTLMKIIAGLHGQYDGRMAIDGRPVHFRSPREALAAGIGMVHQELSVVPDLTVAENVYLGPAARRAASSTGAPWGCVPPQLADLGSTSIRGPDGFAGIGLQQLSSSPRAVLGPRIVILDEPTSALSPPEVQHAWFEVLRGVRASGRSIVFISHFTRDVWRSPTPSRSSATAGSSPPEAAAPSKGLVIQRMIGRGHEELKQLHRRDRLHSRPRRRRSATCAGGSRPRLRRRIARTSGQARSWASTASWAAA